MSFADLERGSPSHRQPKQDEFGSLANRVSLQVFKINGNVTGLSKLVDLLGTPRDTPAIRKRLHDLTQVTRDLAKSSSDDVKRLASFTDTTKPQQIEQARISRDFQTSIVSFQRIQKASAEKQKLTIDRASSHADSSSSPVLPRNEETGQLLELEDTRPQQQQQVQIEAIPDSELEYQEQLIEEREGEIREIESGIHELNEIFRDLGTIVHEQQSMLDNIETNVNNIATDTDRAAEELTKAHRYQKRAGRRLLCLLMIFFVVLAIVLIAVLA